MDFYSCRQLNRVADRDDVSATQNTCIVLCLSATSPVGYNSAGVAVCGAGLSGVEGKGRAAYRHHGQTKIGLVKRDVCVEAQRNGAEPEAARKGTTRSSTNYRIARSGRDLKQSWSGA